MPLLYMQTDEARSKASSIAGIAQVILESCNAIQAAGTSIVWESSASIQFHDELYNIRQTLSQLAEQADQLSSRLRTEAGEWEAVASGSSSVGEFSFPGTTASQAYINSMVMAGGGASLAFNNLFNNPLLLLFVPGLRPYLLGHALGAWIKEQTLTIPVQPEPPAARPVVTNYFGELTKKIEAEITPAETLARNSLPVPLLGQGDTGGRANCAPTSISMIMNYWHNKNENNPVFTPDQLYSEAVEQKFFSHAQGIDFFEAKKLFEAHGYEAEVMTFQNLADVDLQGDLRLTLKDGPVMALVRLNLSSSDSSGGHAVVITGLSDDGSLIRINDPWQDGKAIDLPWEKFTASWNSFSEASDRTFISVKPKEGQP